MTQLALVAEPRAEIKIATAPSPAPSELPPAERTVEKMIRYCRQPGQDILKDLVGGITPIAVTDNERAKMVEYLKPDGRPAIFTVERTADHEVVTRLGERDVDMELTCPKCEEGLTDLLGAILSERIIEEFGKEAIASVAGNEDTADPLWIAIHTTVLHAIRMLTRPSELPEGVAEPAESARRGLAAERRLVFNRMVRTHIMGDLSARTAIKTLKQQRTKKPSAAQITAALRGETVRATPRQFRRRKGYIDRTVMEEAAKKAAARIRPRRAIEYAEHPDGEASIRVMATPSSEEAQIRKNRDGTISMQREPALGPEMRRINLNSMRFGQPAIGEACAELMLQLLKVHEDAGQLVWEHCGTHGHEVRQRARQMVEERMLPPRMPKRSRTKSVQIDQIASQLTRLTRERLCTQETIRRTERAAGDGRWRMHQYNDMAMNADVYEETWLICPSVGRYYMDNMFMRDQAPQRLASTGDMMTAVQEDTGLTGSAWRWMLRMEGRWSGQAKHKRQLAPVCELLHEANRRDSDPYRVIAVSSMALDVEIFRREAQQGDDRRWKGATRAVNRFLERSEIWTDREARDLRHVVDAIRSAEGINWGPGTWDEMTRRAERIVQRDRDMRQAALAQGPQARERWESRLGETDIGQYRFEPVTSAEGLAAWGRVMRNCLGMYGDRCAEGRNRIFVIRRPGETEPVGAVELAKSSGSWRTIQIEGPGRRAVPEDARAACGQLAVMYERADPIDDNLDQA